MKSVAFTMFTLLMVLVSSSQVQAEKLWLHLLDVGEGQAVLLHKNRQAILVDTGHAGAATRVLNRIQELGVESLDYLILTHLHPDHASGLFRIHEAYPETVVADNCHPIEETATPDMVRWVDQGLQQISNRRCLKAGDRIDWAEVTISVLWPLAQPEEKSPLNQNSLVLKIEHNEKTMLIMGDAGHAAEKALLERNRLYDIDLLVVGHHGAADATSDAFLRVVQPEHALISINKDNVRGYPSPEVLKLLKNHGVKVHRTYVEGEFSVGF